MVDERALKQLSVLYVEDEPYLREEISTFLKRRVGHLVMAEDGVEGMKAFEKQMFNLVITDLKMPNMDGLEMAKALRDLGSDIPIIITTAISDVALMQQSIEIGIERYLLKPIDVTALLGALEAVQRKIEKQDKRHDFDVLDVAKLKGFEKKIEAEVAKLIKATSGKGPQRVTCHFNANILEIIIKDSRTLLESTLLATDENRRIVDYLRETYYQQLKDEIRKIVHEVTSYHAVWLNLACMSEKDEDRIKIMLDV